MNLHSENIEHLNFSKIGKIKFLNWNYKTFNEVSMMNIYGTVQITHTWWVDITHCSLEVESETATGKLISTKIEAWLSHLISEKCLENVVRVNVTWNTHTSIIWNYNWFKMSRVVLILNKHAKILSRWKVSNSIL